MDRKPTLLEGLRIPRKIFNQFISKIEEEETFRLGFEVEFYAENFVGGDVVIDLSDASIYEAMDYFEFNNSVDVDKLYDWVWDNLNVILRQAGTSSIEIEQEIMDEWFKYNPDWYFVYLKERGEWDEDNETPTEDATSEKDAEDDVIEKVTGESEFQDRVQERIDEEVERIDLADLWWNEDHWALINASDWELSGDYVFDENDSDIIREVGSGGYEAIANILKYDDDIIGDAEVEGDYEYSWVVKEDSSLRGEGGVEIASPVFPIMTGLEQIKVIFNLMQTSLESATDQSTGLHVSISFTEEKAFDDIDWVKVAVLSGEEYMLKQFDRLQNTYTRSQFEKMRNAAASGRLGDLSGMRTFQELKDKFAQGIATGEKYSSFNISDYGSGGRVEWRIMGGRDYETKFDTVQNNVLKMAFAMEIGSDPDAFKNEYLRELGKLLSRVINKQEDPLEKRRQDLYGTDKESAILRRNPSYAAAVTLFRKSPALLETYKKVTLAAEKTRDDDATKDDWTSYIKMLGVFVDDIIKIETQTYEKIFAISARVGSAQSIGESIVTEVTNGNVEILSAKKILLQTIKRYGYSANDFKERYQVDAHTALIEHFPIADHLTAIYSIIYYDNIAASMYFSDMNEEHSKLRRYFMSMVPILTTFDPRARDHFIFAIAESRKYSDTNRQKSVAKSIASAIERQIAVNNSAINGAPENNITPAQRTFIEKIISDFGVDLRKIMLVSNNPELLQFALGPPQSEELRKELEYVTVLSSIIPSNSTLNIIQGLKSDNKNEVRDSAIALALHLSDVIYEKMSKPVVQALMSFIEDYNLAEIWSRSNISMLDHLKAVIKH